MAPKTEDKKKRRNKRKSRTEVSEISSSEDETPAQNESRVQKKSLPTRPEAVAEPASDSEQENTAIAVPEKKVKVDHDQAFEDFYLRQATREFANDLDKLRSTSDWKGEESLSMLVRGLKSGAKGFGAREREDVVGGGR